jgi:hypothetical protein
METVAGAGITALTGGQGGQGMMADGVARVNTGKGSGSTGINPWAGGSFNSNYSNQFTDPDEEEFIE